MDKISNIITDFYVKKAYISEDMREIYNYGFKLIISDIINFTIILSVGIILGKLLDSILYLSALSCIRRFSGGFHANTYLICRLSMILTFLCVLAMSYIIGYLKINTIILFIIMDSAAAAIMYIKAPVPHPNKKITDENKMANKRKAIVSTVLFSLLSLILVVFGREEGNIISLTILAIVILMIIGSLTGERREINV